jgi:hypothetical protein
MVVDGARRDGADGLGFPLKRTPSEALLRQCRRYREAGVLLMLEARALREPAWQSVVDAYRILLNDNPGSASLPELDLAAKRLAWIRLQTEKPLNIADYREWGLSWLADVGHGEEDNWVTQGLVVTKWEAYLQTLFVILKGTRLIVTM